MGTEGTTKGMVRVTLMITYVGCDGHPTVEKECKRG